MTHLSEEQLILHHYGETLTASEGEQVRAHLATCTTCRGGLSELGAVLDRVSSAPVPSRPASYGTAVWQRLLAELPQASAAPRRRAPWSRRLGLAMGLAASLLLAFMVGRITVQPPEPAASGGDLRTRILLVSVGEHLERSRMLLVELSNEPDAPLDERARLVAEDLVSSNRLYRQAAGTTGEVALEDGLAELESILLEMANTPGNALGGDDLVHIRESIDSRDLLFKIRVLEKDVKRRELQTSRPVEQTETRL